MKLKNKIIITGISALSLIGTSTFAVNGISDTKQSNMVNPNSRKTKNKSFAKQKLNTIAEVEQYIPGISGYNNLYFDNIGYAGFYGGNPAFGFDSTPETTASLEESSPGSGTFRFSVKVDNASGEYGYLYQYRNDLPYVNSYDSSYSDLLEIYKYGDHIIFIPTVIANTDDLPLGTYYDITPDGLIQEHGLTFPDAALDTWNFKVKINVNPVVSGVTTDGFNTISFDIIEPSSNTNPSIQPTSFEIFVDGTSAQTETIVNAGVQRKVTVDNELINPKIAQEIKIVFNNDTFSDITFSTTSQTMAEGILSVDQYSEEVMKLKIDGFTNGVGWAEADRFEVSINGAVRDVDKHLISELDTGEFTKDLDVTEYPAETDLTIKIVYYRDDKIVEYSNEVTIAVPLSDDPGIYYLEDLFEVGKPETYGEVKVILSGQKLLPNSTHIRVSPTRIDETFEEHTPTIIPIPDEGVSEVVLSLSHPAEYQIDVEYLDMNDPVNEKVTLEPVPLTPAADIINTKTGATQTLLNGVPVLSSQSENAFSLRGKFDIGIDENGDELTGESFELLLNDVSLDSNLLSDDYSNIIDPLTPSGTFDKTYTDIALGDYGVTPGVETNLKIMLNGNEVWTSKITFVAKQFEIANLEVKAKDYTTATIGWEMTQGTGIEEATKYTIQAFDNDPAVIDPVFEETVVLATSPNPERQVTGLSSGKNYTVKIQFMNSDDTPLLDLPQEISFTTEQDLFEMTDLVIQDKTETSAKIVFDGFKQGTGDEIATQYTLKVTEAANLTPPIDLTITDLTNKYYELTNLAPGGTYTVEIQFKNSEDANLLTKFTKTIVMNETEFKVEGISTSDIDYETAKINFDGLEQGTGSQIATKYELELYKAEEIVPTLEEGTIGADLFHNLTGLESGVTYNVKVKFINSTDVVLSTKELLTPFETLQDNFELEGGITAEATGDLSASVSFGILKQGTGNQKATSYEVSWFNEGTEVGSATEQILDGDTEIDPYSITTGLEEGQTYTVKVQFKSGTTNLIEYTDDFTLTQVDFEFTGIDTTNIGENSADILLQGIQQGTGTQEATTGVITITGAKTLPAEGEPTTETWELPIDMSNGIPSSYSLDGLILASEYTVSVEFKNSAGTLLGVSHTNTFSTTSHTVIDTSISNFNTVFDSKTNTVNFTWNYVQGIDKYGREDAVPNIDMTLNFPNQQVKKEYTFSGIASTGTFTIDLNKMIEEKQITQADIDNGFTIESNSGIIEFENSKFTWTVDNTFWTIMAISLLTAGAYLLIKLISKRRKIIL